MQEVGKGLQAPFFGHELVRIRAGLACFRLSVGKSDRSCSFGTLLGCGRDRENRSVHGRQKHRLLL